MEKDVVAKKLRLANTNDWYVSDYRPESDLCQIHYHDDGRRDLFGHLRGNIYQLSTGILLSRSYGYLPEMVIDKLPIFGNSLIINISGLAEKLPLKELSFHPGLDGLLLQIWRYRGKSYLSSPKKIDIRESDSRIGDSLTFKEMYRIAAGPDPDKFFEGPDSDWVHIVLLVHPDLLHVSRIVLPDPIASVYYISSMKIGKRIGDRKIIPSMPRKKPLSIEEANRYLYNGGWEMADNEELSPYFRPSEPVIAIHNQQGYRFIPPGYHWRDQVRCHPNLLYNIFVLSSNRSLPKFPYHKESHLKMIVESGIPLMQLPRSRKISDGSNFRSRVYNVLIALLLAVPIHLQPHLFIEYLRFFEKRQLIVSALTDLIIQKRPYPAKQIVIQRISEQVANDDLLLIPETLEKKIEELLDGIDGEHLYRLYRYLEKRY